MIFYEDKYAKQLLKNGFTSFMNSNDLSILAKYFKYIGKSKSQIKESLLDFCKKFNPNFNEVLSRNKINYALKTCSRYGLRIPADVIITETEMEIIKNCGNYKRQKVLFVMLVLSKYSKYNNTNLNKKEDDEENKESFDDLETQNNNFYVNEKFINILKLAKVNVSRVERMEILNDLQRNEYILTKRKNRNGGIFYKIMFIDELSPISVVISDLDNMIDFLPFYCEKCGKLAIKIGKKHDMCLECYQNNSKELTKNRVKKYRNKSM